MAKITIEIWSDIMCPFCYIGKRRFDAALAQSEHSNDVEVIWKSFMLSPDLVTGPSKNSNQFLAEHKGISVEQARGMNDYVANMAAQSGLTFHFDKTVVANSFNAHRFSHFAKEHGRQNEAEELLFAAYFTEGKNIDDAKTLLDIALQLGLDAKELSEAMASGNYANAVADDIAEAQQLGIRGVPFFVFNRKFAVSGAQDVSVFADALEKAYND